MWRRAILLSLLVSGCGEAIAMREAQTTLRAAEETAKAGKPRDALTRYQRALGLAEVEHDAGSAVAALRGLGVSYRALEEHEAAVRSLRAALNRCEPMASKAEYAGILAELG